MRDAGGPRIRGCQCDQTSAGVDEQPHRSAVDRSVEDDVALFVCGIDERIACRGGFGDTRSSFGRRDSVLE